MKAEAGTKESGKIKIEVTLFSRKEGSGIRQGDGVEEIRPKVIRRG